MPVDNRISETVPPADLAAARQHLEQAHAILKPYLESLTGDEKSALFKMSDRTRPFVEKVLGYLDTNPEFAPPYLAAAELKRDFELVLALTPLLNLTDQIIGPLSDTITLAGSEAAAQSLTYYNAVRQASHDNVPRAREIYADLSTRFPGRSTKSPQTPG